jgi:hypothetical protein
MVFYVVYGTHMDIERNDLGISQPFKDSQKALDYAKKQSKLGFASVIENPTKFETEDDVTMIGGDRIGSFWNKKYWEEFIRKYAEVVEW